MKNKIKWVLNNIAFVLVIVMVACTSKSDFEKGKEQLQQQGYTQIENTGHEWFCCDEKDTFSTGFSCYAKDGKKVTGCFCSTALKGVTIRFN